MVVRYAPWKMRGDKLRWVEPKDSLVEPRGSGEPADERMNRETLIR